MNGLRLTGLLSILILAVALTVFFSDRPDDTPISVPTSSVDFPTQKNSIAQKPISLPTSTEKITDPLLRQIASIINRFHYVQPDKTEVLNHLESLDSLPDYLLTLDPYSRLVTKDQLKFINRRASPVRTGPGIDYLFDKNVVLAVPVFDAPFYQGGQETAVILESINGQSINLNDFSGHRFLGFFQNNDEVVVRYSDFQGSTSRSLRIAANTYPNPPLRYYRSGESLIIEIRQFKSGFTNQLSSALHAARQSEQLIIDLRFSPGGDIYAMTDWLSLLLPADKTVATLKKQDSRKPVALKTLSGRIDLDIPILILTSKFTASSAEIFAHVLTHYHSGVTVVGESGKGKCLAQEIYTINEELSLILSSYEVLLPNGLSCENNSLSPTAPIKEIALIDIEEILSRIND